MKNVQDADGALERTLYERISMGRESVQADSQEILIFNKVIFPGNMELSGCDLKRMYFYDCIFSGCDFSNANLSLGVLAGCHFDNCDLSGLNFTCGSMYDTQFNQCKLDNADLKSATMRHIQFTECSTSNMQLPTMVFEDIRGLSPKKDRLLDQIKSTNEIRKELAR